MKSFNMTVEARKYLIIEQVMRCDENELKKIESFLVALSASLDKALQQAEKGKVTPYNEERRVC